MIKIDFERETRHGIYRDAITLPEDHNLSQKDIESIMQQRVDKWVDFMDNPPEVSPELKPIEIDGMEFPKVF